MLVKYSPVTFPLHQPPGEIHIPVTTNYELTLFIMKRLLTRNRIKPVLLHYYAWLNPVRSTPICAHARVCVCVCVCACTQKYYQFPCKLTWFTDKVWFTRLLDTCHMFLMTLLIFRTFISLTKRTNLVMAAVITELTRKYLNIKYSKLMHKTKKHHLLSKDLCIHKQDNHHCREKSQTDSLSYIVKHHKSQILGRNKTEIIRHK